MKRSRLLKFIWVLLFMTSSSSISAQIEQGVYLSVDNHLHHELKVFENYLIHSVYEKSPAKFIKTVGGFYTIDNSLLKVALEFNSDFKKDALQNVTMSMQIEDDKLILEATSKIVFKRQEMHSQDLDGLWLFATRGPDKGQDRRGEKNARKTLKFLIDGRFQWIAYHTETFKFSGTGGGSYTSQDGIYTENIEFFSRDNSRVGASLNFNYELKNTDWHHTGKNSKGEPMYEIWAKR